MKIIQINVVYKNGSTGKIVNDIHKFLLQNGIESVICYGRGKISNESNVYKTSYEILSKFNALKSRFTGLQYNGSWFATTRLINIIKKEKPDVVHLHCLNGYFVNIYRLINFLKKKNIETVLTLHAEFMHTGSCSHAYDCEKWKVGCGNCPQLWLATKSYWLDRTDFAWIKMKNAFDNFNNLKIISVSKWLESRANESPIMKDHIFHVINNGIDTNNVFKPTNYKYLKDKLGLQDEKVLLHVTASFTSREDDIKGGRYIIQLANKLIDKNIKIIVVGCRDLTIHIPNNIINIGIVYNQKDLAAFYSMADLTVLTSKRETFSMICAESLSCGTPIVGFKAGAPETIALHSYSEFVEYGNIEKLENTIIKWLNLKIKNKEEIIDKAKEVYSKEKMCQKYLSVYKGELKDYDN